MSFFWNLSLCPPLPHTHHDNVVQVLPTTRQTEEKLLNGRTHRRLLNTGASQTVMNDGTLGWTRTFIFFKDSGQPNINTKNSVTSPSENCQPLQTNNAAFLPYLSLIALQGTEAAPKIELIPGPFFQTGRAAIVRALDQTSWMTAYENENSF